VPFLSENKRDSAFPLKQKKFGSLHSYTLVCYDRTQICLSLCLEDVTPVAVVDLIIFQLQENLSYAFYVSSDRKKTALNRQSIL